MPSKGDLRAAAAMLAAIAEHRFDAGPVPDDERRASARLGERLELASRVLVAASR